MAVPTVREAVKPSCPTEAVVLPFSYAFTWLRLRGYAASWLSGFVAIWLGGYVATWLWGFVATWLRGYVATWLRGSAH